MTRLFAAVAALGALTASAQAQYEPIDQTTETLLQLTTSANETVETLRNADEYDRLQSAVWSMYRSADRIHSWVSGRKNYDRIHSELVRMEGQYRNAETLLRGMQAGQRVGAVDPRAVSQLAYTLRQTQAVIQDMQVQMGAPGAAYRPSYSPYDRDARSYDRNYDSRRVYRFRPVPRFYQSTRPQDRYRYQYQYRIVR